MTVSVGAVTSETDAVIGVNVLRNDAGSALAVAAATGAAFIRVNVLAGSGATVDNLAELAGVADTVIVGSSLKYDGETVNRVDPVRAGEMVDHAPGSGSSLRGAAGVGRAS